MRSSQVVPGEGGFAQQFGNLRRDARGAGNLLAHQQLGAIALPTNPTDGKTLTLTINGSDIVTTFVAAIGTGAGNVLIGSTVADTIQNILALLEQPQTTTSTGIGLSAADQALVRYLSWSLSGTTITPSSNDTTLFAPLSSFSIATDVTGASWTAQTMQLYVEPGVVYVGGTRVIFEGGSTPTVTAPSSHPRIDVLAIDSSGALSWTTGTEDASPVAPDYPANKVPLCELYNVVGETVLTDGENQTSGGGYVSNDVRPIIGTAVNLGSVSSDIIPDADGTRDLGSLSKEFDNLYVKSGIFLNGSGFGSQLTFTSTALEAINTGAPVAVGLTQSTDIGHDTSGETTATGSITIGSNPNRVLVVVAMGHANFGSSCTISGTFAGSSLSFANAAHSDGSGNPFSVGTAILVAPPTGSGSFSLSAAGSGAAVDDVFYFSLYDCDQSSPQDNLVTASASSATTITASMAIETHGALAISAIYSANPTSTIGTVSGLAYSSNTSTGSNHAYAIGNSGGSNIFPAGTTVAISNSGGTTSTWLGAVISIKPVNAASIGLLNASSASVAIGNTRCTGFLGFALTTVTSGQPLTAITQGVASGLSGLSLGIEYYLNDTNGTVGTSAGTNTRKVGVATDETHLLITNIW